MKKQIRYGVIGLARGLDMVLENLDDPRGRLVAACDKNPKTMEKAKEKLARKGVCDCAFYEDFDEMLKSELDAVIIATDAVCHVPFVVRAMDAGLHVLCEIPSVNTIEEAKLLKKTVNSHPDLIYMAAENCCYWAFVEAWKTMFEEGKLGEVVYAEGEYLHSIDPEKFSPENYPKGHWRITNPPIKYLTHELGPLLYILDDRCVSVTCMESDVIYNPYYPKKKGTGVAMFKTEKGRILHIMVSFGSYTSPDHNFRILGTRGSLETDRLKKVYDAHTFANLQSIPGTFLKKLDIPVTTAFAGDTAGTHGGGDRRMMRDFFKCVTEGIKPKLDVDFAIRMTIPGIIAHESAVQGGVPLEIPNFDEL